MLEFDNDIYSIDFARTKVIWTFGMPIIVPENFPTEYVRKIKAGVRAAHTGSKSVDNILKNTFPETEYYEIEERNNQEYQKSELKEYEDLRNKFFYFQETTYSKYDKILKNIDFEKYDLVFSHCGIIYKKLDSNFSALRMLIKYDYIYESYAIIRQMVEQIAFAFDSQFKNELEELTSPTKSISKLKEFYSYVGIFYGELSSKSHIDKTQFKNYFIVNPDKPKDNGVMLRSREDTILICHRALIMLDLYCCVFEYIFYDEIINFSCINKDRKLKKSRKTRKFVNNFTKEYSNLIKKYIS